MSYAFSCNCPERRVPLAERKWFVVQRKYRLNVTRYSRFPVTSKCSLIECAVCDARWYTAAKYAERLRDAKKD